MNRYTPPKQQWLIMPKAWLLLLDNATSELHPTAKKLRRLLENDEEIYLTGMIIHDVLHHIKGDAAKQKVWDLLATANYIEITREEYHLAGLQDDEDPFTTIHRLVADRRQLEILGD